jgi:hypothetical protein
MNKSLCKCCSPRKRQPMVPVGDLRICPVCDGGAMDVVVKRDQAR